MIYEIANIMIEIKCNIRDIILPMYKQFERTNLENGKEKIRIDICDVTECEEYVESPNFQEETYKWITNKNKKILIFSKRGEKLKNCDTNDMWMLSSCQNLNEWKLFIPELKKIDKYILEQELQKRPWLQRLFITYVKGSGKAVVHGAVCIIEGKGCLFLGESGSGKSTICSIIGAEQRVLADDRFVLSSEKKGLVAFGTPWNIKNSKYCVDDCILIESVYFLKHGNNDLIKLCKDSELLIRLMKQVLHSGAYTECENLFWKVNVVKRIIEMGHEFYEFQFEPNESCLDYIM